MKKLLFLLPFVLVLAFCAKEESVTESNSTPVPVAGDRGGPCTLTITTTGTLEVCGDIVQNNNPCQSCQIGGTTGQEFIAGTTVYTVNVSQVRLFTVRNNTAQNLTFGLSTSGGANTGGLLKPGQCANYAIGGDCLLVSGG